MLTIDGRRGEGGGQVLRSALAFSAFTGQAFTIHHIRGGRSKPGLRHQHLAAVRLVQSLCGAEISPVEVGASELVFRPGPLRGGRHEVDVGTAGSVTLLTQASLVPALMAGEPVELRLRGGTDVPKSPPLDFLTSTVLPYFERLGTVAWEVERRGFMPAGGGTLILQVQGHRGRRGALDLTERADPEAIEGQAVASEALRSARVAERLAETVEEELGVSPRVSYQPSDSPGAVLTLWGRSGDVRLAVGGLGRRGLSSERLAGQIIRRWNQQVAASEPVGEYLADQLVPLLALGGGTMLCQTISLHCQTNMEICSLFTGTKFHQDGLKIMASSDSASSDSSGG